LPELLPGEQRRKIDIPHLSPSAIKLYRRCSASFYFKYKQGMREALDSNLLRGSAVHTGGHAFLQALREDQRAGREPILQRLITLAKVFANDYITAELAKAGEEMHWRSKFNKSKDIATPATLRATVERAIDILGEHSWIGMQPVEIESGYLIYWDEEHRPPNDRTLPLLAYADVIEHLDTPQGRVARVRDIKTGAKKNFEDVKLDIALSSYCAAHEAHHNIPTRLVGYDNLVTNATPLYNPIFGTRCDTDFQRLYRSARIVTKAIRAGIYDPKDDPMVCSRCDYRAACQAEFL
jgi:hypothetical protein